MFVSGSRSGISLALLTAVVLISGCGSKVQNRAPVEDRGSVAGRPAPVAIDATLPAVKQLPGAENAGKPGYYTVKPGDMLIRIAVDHGQSPKDIARWSNVDNPNRIEIGQVLRVAPPVPATSTAGVVTRPVTASTVTPVTAGALPPAGGPDKPAATAGAAASAPVAASSSPATDDEIRWIWPTQGVVLAGFDEAKNKGLDIGGSAGDPVLAAADGRVVYVGAGLRGYGNLIILKHNNMYLTAYAHNQTLLIKEDQSVRQGQKIAEMGSSDADRVKLHFEVRRQGKPVDPAKYLPAR
ncbi:MAG: peptidoglycan DD-metalloendopeptidase family protein [Rhodoferax sp.]|nr:peptidoglycan DD-metalloendopeptidase family protein [Rhodoferax sp.]